MDPVRSLLNKSGVVVRFLLLGTSSLSWGSHVAFGCSFDVLSLTPIGGFAIGCTLAPTILW